MRKNEAKFTTVFFSEAGTKNKNNDYFGYVQLDNYAIWVVADGFDEEEGADVAARLAVESAIEYFMLHPEFSREIISEIMSYVNLKVREKQTETERYSLMHTSLLIVISNYNALLYGNIGNTRFYHLRNGYVISQSSDDTVAQLLVEEEALNTGDLKYHRQRNDLLQAIGDYGKIKPNILKTPVILQEKDTFCLTTIGFWENIDEKEMEVELSRYDEGKKWLVSLEKKVVATLRDNVENYTFAAVTIEDVAEPLPMEKNNRKFFMKIALVAIASILIILTLTLWHVKKKKDIMNKVTVYEQQAEEELIKKNFENSVKELELVIGEYEKLKPKSRGIIGFFLNADARRKEMDRKRQETKSKIKDTEKLKKVFSDIREGNELFNSGNYEEASKKYQEAKYSLEQNTYKRDEVNTEEVLSEINSRIEATSKLKEAKNLEMTGDTAFTSGNYNLAKENYKMASDIYLANGRADYVSSMEEKIREINDKEKTEEYINEAKVLGIEVKGPNILKSTLEYSLEENKLYYPLIGIKGIGLVLAEKINNITKSLDIYDMFVKLYEIGIRENTFEILIKVGAFDSYKINRRSLIEALSSLINYAELKINYFSDDIKPVIVSYKDYTELEKLEMERELLGFYLSSYPTSLYKKEGFLEVKDIDKYINKDVTLVLYINRIKEIITKNGEKMAFVDASDKDKVSLTIFPKNYKEIEVNKKDIVEVNGQVTIRNGERQIIVKNIKKLTSL